MSTDPGPLDWRVSIVDNGGKPIPEFQRKWDILRNLNSPIYANSYIVSALPSASPPAGLIYVSNESGGAVMAFSDGTHWRRVTDRAIVS